MSLVLLSRTSVQRWLDYRLRLLNLDVQVRAHVLLMSFCRRRVGRPLVLPLHPLARVGLGICQLFSRLPPRLILIEVQLALVMGLLGAHHFHA